MTHLRLHLNHHMQADDANENLLEPCKLVKYMPQSQKDTDSIFCGEPGNTTLY
jgi:hypothetical protein